MSHMTWKALSTKKVVQAMVIAASIVTITVGLGTIWGWITGPKSSLEGVFFLGVYQEPTSIADVVDEVSNALLRLDEDIFDALSENEILLPSVRSSQVSSIIRSATDDLQDRRRPLLQRNRQGGHLVGVVSNSGSTTLENVRVYLPDVVEAEFLLDGEARSVREEFGTIPVLVLGTLPPGMEVPVFAWTRGAVLSRFNLSNREIRLAHSDGYGDVSVQIPTGRLGQWVERIGPIVFGLFAGLMVMLAAWLITESVARRNQSQSGTEP